MKKMKLTKYIITLMTALLVMGMTSNSVLATKFPVEYDNHKKVKKTEFDEIFNFLKVSGSNICLLL